MKTSSAKSKGRRLCAEVAELLRVMLKVELDDVRVTPSGVNGPDVQLSPLAKRKFPFCIEAKNQEKISIWAAIKQAEDNALKHGGTPMLVFGRNRTQPYVAIPLEALARLYRVPDDVPETL